MFQILAGILLIAAQFMCIFYFFGLMACAWTTVMKDTPGKFCIVCKGRRWPWNY